MLIKLLYTFFSKKIILEYNDESYQALNQVILCALSYMHTDVYLCIIIKPFLVICCDGKIDD